MIKKRNMIGIIAVFSMLAFASSTFAIEAGQLPGGEGLVPPPIEQVDDSLANDDLKDQVLTIVNYFLTFLGLIAIVAIIYFGFLMIVAGGDEEQYTKARKGIIYVGIGIVLILLSYAIVSFFVSATIEGADAASTSPVGFNTRREFPERDEAEYHLQKKIETIYLELEEGDASLALYRDLSADLGRIFEGLPAGETAAVLRYHFDQGDLKRKYENIFSLFAQAEGEVATQFAAGETDEGKALESLKKKLITGLRDLADAMERLPRIEVDIKAQPSGGSAPLTVTLSGIETVDPSRMTVPKDNFRWSYLDNDGTYRDLGTGVVKVHTFEEANAYRVRLRVTSLDPTVLPGIHSERIEVKPRETRADFTINGEEVVTVHNVSLKEAAAGIEFDPIKTVPGDGVEILEYRWDFRGHTESRSSAEKVLHPFASTGDYKVALTVIDSIGNRDKKTVTINVNPSIAVIKMFGTAKQVGSEITFDGTDSSIEDTPTFQYLWELYDESGTKLHTFSNPRFPFTFETPGDYKMELTVGKGFKTIETFTITPRPPVPVFSAEVKSPAEPGVYRFDASESGATKKSSLQYAWDFDGDGKFDAQGVSDPIIEHDYTAPGQYAVTLEITDEYGVSARTVKTIQVESVFNARLLPERLAVQVGDDIGFRADASAGIEYAWDFGDGNTSEQPENATHVYTAPGEFEVRVTVTDALGNTNSAAEKILVGEAGSVLPVVFLTVKGERRTPSDSVCKGGPAITLARNETLELDATRSLGVTGNTSGLDYVWDFHDNSFADGGRISRKFSELSSSDDCERITLTVADGEKQATREIYVFIQNSPPVLAGLSVETASEQCSTPCLVDLTAIGASDPDGRIGEYRWWAYRIGDPEKIGYTVTTDPRTTISIPARGLENDQNQYHFVVELVDAYGESVLSEDLLGRSSAVTVINRDNPVPIIEFVSDRQYVNTNMPVTFSANVSFSDGSTIGSASYDWDFDGDGEFDDTSGGATVSHSFAEPGTYQVRLRATVNGIAGSITRTITVTEGIGYPLASFFYTATDETLVVFDASDSRSDPVSAEGLEYAWDFDTTVDSDGNTIPDDDTDASGVTAEHRFASAGEYEVALRVFDAEGGTAEERQLVRLGLKEAAPPLAFGTPFAVSPRLTSATPMATLQLLVRKNPSATDLLFDIMAYGTDLGLTSYTGPARFRIVQGEGEFVTADTAPFENGFASLQIRALATDSPLSIEVATDSLLGGIGERIEFVPSHFSAPTQ